MREDKNMACGDCGQYIKSILKFLASHIGLVSLVVGYTIIGAIIFVELEAEHEMEVKKAMSSKRLNVTDDLWTITGGMKVLNEMEWSEQVRTRLQAFEKDLINAIKMEGWDGEETGATKQWTFAGALFYSIILITTIGYGHIAPKTPWGKVVTIFYAIPGVPLMMLCLANIGDGMAHSFRFIYWKVCCYVCTKRPKRRRRTRSTRSTRRMYDDMYDADIRGMQRNRPSENSQQNRHAEQNHQTRTSHNSKGSSEPAANHQRDFENQDDCKVAVLYNKYALEKEGLSPDVALNENEEHPTEKNADVKPEREGRDRRSDRRHDAEVDLHITTQPTSQRGPPPAGYSDSPPMPRSPRDSGRYSGRHLPPPEPRGRLSRLDEEYYYDDYDDYDDEIDDVPADDRPVPIWLGIMLVVAYIFGGAFLFSGWENWGFLDSVYFCFITLTTIGFGDFVPAESQEKNPELSIALCSIYLLFGIALLAMSFNLVQEEVINNVKIVAKRLGIIKDEEVEEEEE
ncbi:potassium two pore domain channel subfamily K member galene isoform X2 [Oratosquilla oratoria]|uniref:potassium two pore domain channel subfamily K member galene isoform X2 n=1 Tax=Oratosquilla oratoria TaxID=337810 RepID=UPI003F76DBFB